jgi:hypothetical protein
LHRIGSYGNSGTSGSAATGLQITPNGTTILVASILELGHAFHANLTPSPASTSLKSITQIPTTTTIAATTTNPFKEATAKSKTLILQQAEMPMDTHEEQKRINFRVQQQALEALPLLPTSSPWGWGGRA